MPPAMAVAAAAAAPRSLLFPVSPSPSQPRRVPALARAGRSQRRHAALARPARRHLDDAMSAGFVRSLNAPPDEDGAGSGGRYDPRPGDFAVGVVVSGTEARLDVAVGADRLATLLAKELLPLYRADLPAFAEAAPPRPGSVGVVASPAAGEGDRKPGERGGGRTLVPPGTVVFAEVLGRTLSGRPLLSARRLFRRLAWHRARQVMQLDEPIEGLRAFLPKFELMDRINTFTDLKNKVGCSIRVCITRLDEETNDLIISEKKAWEMTYLKEGTLLQGIVHKIFPYGAQVRIAGTNRSGLLHISNISRGRVLSVTDILKIDEEVKVLVVKSNVPDKIALSISDLESTPGLFLSEKARVFSEAEEMAERYREQLPADSKNAKLDADLPGGTIPFDDEATLYANWKWFKFLEDGKLGAVTTEHNGS
uniref:S1 motif domain-containing protein n=1 Tax=Oryza glumipatula TaxID=40148 RepID=A0A0D9YB48_9ORYZ